MGEDLQEYINKVRNMETDYQLRSTFNVDRSKEVLVLPFGDTVRKLPSCIFKELLLLLLF